MHFVVRVSNGLFEKILKKIKKVLDSGNEMVHKRTSLIEKNAKRFSKLVQWSIPCRLTERGSWSESLRGRIFDN